MKKTVEQRIREKLQEAVWMRRRCAEDGGPSWFTRTVRQSAIRTVRQQNTPRRDSSVPKQKGRRLHLEEIESIWNENTYTRNTTQDKEK